jgi:hypothetical protein
MEDVKFELLNTWYSNGTPCFAFYREPVTDVMYVEKRQSGGMTAMLHPETGKPLTYTEYKNMRGNHNGTS